MTPTYLIANLMLVQVVGPGSLPAKKVDQLIQRVERKFLRAGIRIRVRSNVRIKDPAPKLNTRDDAEGRFYVLEALTKRKRETTTHLILPPIEGTWMHGMARLASYHRGGFSVSVGKLGREAASAQGAAHEIAHTFGAGHVESETIMHADALRLAAAGRRLSRWDRKSIREMRGYLR